MRERERERENMMEEKRHDSVREENEYYLFSYVFITFSKKIELESSGCSCFEANLKGFKT